MFQLLSLMFLHWNRKVVNMTIKRLSLWIISVSVYYLQMGKLNLVKCTLSVIYFCSGLPGFCLQEMRNGALKLIGHRPMGHHHVFNYYKHNFCVFFLKSSCFKIKDVCCVNSVIAIFCIPWLDRKSIFDWVISRRYSSLRIYQWVNVRKK